MKKYMIALLSCFVSVTAFSDDFTGKVLEANAGAFVSGWNSVNGNHCAFQAVSPSTLYYSFSDSSIHPDLYPNSISAAAFKKAPFQLKSTANLNGRGCWPFGQCKKSTLTLSYTADLKILKIELTHDGKIFQNCEF